MNRDILDNDKEESKSYCIPIVESTIWVINIILIYFIYKP